MNQLPISYPSIYQRQPNYTCNGVKIDIHNPQAGMPLTNQTRPTQIQPTIYNYPQGSVYAQNPMAYPTPYIADSSAPKFIPMAVPAQAYTPQAIQTIPQSQHVKPVIVDDTASKIQPATQQVAMIVPPPPKVVEGPKQIINNNAEAPVAAPKDTMKAVEQQAVANAVKAEDKPQTAKEEPKQEAKVEQKVNETKADAAKAQATPDVQIAKSEEISAKLRGDFVARLQSTDTDEQSKALIEIANATQQLSDAKKVVSMKSKEAPNAPETKAMTAEYNNAFNALAGVVLDEKVVESILATLVKDTSAMEGPTPRQIELRTKEMQGKSLSDAEKAEANTLSPMEKAEQNKEFALFTMRLVQEMYMEGIEKMTGSQPDLKDVPGVEQMVVTVKSNPNPAIRAAAISAMTHNSREQDKEILNTILKIASEQDEDANVREIASQSMARINSNKSN